MVTLNIKKNIPNILTVIRIILVIPIIVLMCLDEVNILYSIDFKGSVISIGLYSIISLILFIIACITDWADGYLSRKYHWVSDFGKILDPIADKLIVNSILILFAVQLKVHVAFVVVFIARDVIVDAIRMMAASKKIIIPANIWGKLKTVLQMLAIIIIFVLGSSYNMQVNGLWYWLVQSIVLYLALFVSLLSGFIYVKNYIKITNKIANY